MFIIELTYKVDLNMVDIHLNDHIEYLNKQYQLGNFIASGPKIPRTGGIIMSKIADRNKLLKIISEDPFNIDDLANYKITEFKPTKTCNELDFLTK